MIKRCLLMLLPRLDNTLAMSWHSSRLSLGAGVSPIKLIIKKVIRKKLNLISCWPLVWASNRSPFKILKVQENWSKSNDHYLRFCAALSRSSQHNSASGSASLISAFTNSACSCKSCWTKSRYFLYWTSQIRRVGVLFVIRLIMAHRISKFGVAGSFPCFGFTTDTDDQRIVISLPAHYSLSYG